MLLVAKSVAPKRARKEIMENWIKCIEEVGFELYGPYDDSHQAGIGISFTAVSRHHKISNCQLLRTAGEMQN